MEVFNINDNYFKYQKCLSGITYQFVNQLDNIYDMNLMVGTNYCLYCMYNEFDIINNFMINFYQVDVCSTENLDLTKKYYQIDGANLRTGHRVLLVNQTDKTQNDVYNVDSRGFLILGDELADTGRTWRYKAYVKLGNNKSKQFHLKNSGNRFPLKGERKDFLDGHGYIVKNFFNYDLFNVGSIVPKLIFTDYEIARVSVNHNYDLYTGFDLPVISSGGTINIKYHNNDYIIRVDNNTNNYIYNGNIIAYYDLSGHTTGGTIYNDITIDNGHETHIEADSNFCVSVTTNDYIKLEISGSTNLYLKTFIKRIESPYIIISDYISSDILNDYYTGSTIANYTLTNLMYTRTSTINDIILESYYSKYFSISGNTIYPVEYKYNKYFDYDGLTFEIGTNTGLITGFINGSILSGATITSDSGEITTSDKFGYYQLKLLVGNYDITASYDHYINLTQNIDVLEDITTGLTFNMIHYTGATSGYTYDYISNLPITGVTVNTGTTSVTSDINGFYIMDNVLSGYRTFYYQYSGYTSGSIGIDVPDGSFIPHNFYLSPTTPSGSISGVTYIHGTSTPISGSTVNIGIISTSTDINGEYLLTGVPYLVQTIYCSSNSYITVSTGVTIGYNTLISQNFELFENVGTVSGTITGKFGVGPATPIDGATVTIGDLSTLSYVDGYYIFDNIVPVGTNIIECSKTGYSGYTSTTIVNYSATTTHDIDLTPVDYIGTVTGYVYNGLDNIGLYEVYVNISNRGSYDKDKLTESDGFYEFTDVPVDITGTDNIISFTKTGYIDTGGTVGIVDYGGTTTYDVNITPSMGTVHGTIFESGSTDLLVNAEISIIYDINHNNIVTYSDVNGMYLFNNNVPIGVNTINCTLLNYINYSSGITVSYDTSIKRDIYLTLYDGPPVGMVYGQVVDNSNDLPLDDVNILILNGVSMVLLTGRTDIAGYYLVENVQIDSVGNENQIFFAKTDYDSLSNGDVGIVTPGNPTFKDARMDYNP